MVDAESRSFGTAPMREKVADFFILDKPSKSTSDAELVGRCLEGDEEAWNALVDKYKNLVWSVPLKYRLNQEDCADIFQAVWLDLFLDLKNLRHSGAVRSWLVSTTSHKCFHWKARQRAAQRVEETLEASSEMNGSTPANLMLELEREQLLREALPTLSPRCQELVRMLFFEQPPRPYEAVAKTMGLAIGSIGFIRGRCLKKLRDWLTERDF